MDRLANSFSVNRALGIRKKENWSDSSALKYSKSAIAYFLFFLTIKITPCCTACSMTHLIKHKVEAHH